MALSRSLNGSLDFSQLKQNWMGEWNEGVIYYLNDTVRLNGKAYVCNSTYFSENNLFGHENKPGVDTTNWTLVINGSVFKGEWAYKDRHYAGDIVRFNEDYYQCLTDNFGGHPIYENGGLSTKWVKIGETSKTDKSRNNVWFPNYPPIGWTRNMCETVEQYGNAGTYNQGVISGNYELNFLGRIHGNDGWGIGERATWLASDNTSASSTWSSVRTATFDMWDWLDGYRPTLTGAAPRIVQVSGTDEFTLVLFDTGEVYHTGYGAHGQTGDGTTSTYQMFRRVGRSGARGTGTLRDKRIIKVGHTAKAGDQGDISTHACFALADDGTVWTWGYNGYCELGQGNDSNLSTPTQINQAWFHNKKIVDMWMFGYNYGGAYAQSEDGELYSWGYGEDGALGTGAYQRQSRPQRVQYNWAKYGGIKKFMVHGTTGEGTAVVLTNNGEIHMTGNISDSGNNIYGIATGESSTDYTCNFQPAHRLYQVRANSMGIGNKSNQQGIMFDVMRKVDECWLIGYGKTGTGAYADNLLIMKEIGTGMLYAVGGNRYLPTYYKQMGFSEDAGITGYVSNNITTPVLLHTGNMTDIKYVQKYGERDFVSLCFLNSDGRIWSNGSDSNSYSRGIGPFDGDPSQIQMENAKQKLPWENYHSEDYWVQARFAEPINLITGATLGWGVLTTNGRYLFCGGNFPWYYGWDGSSALHSSNKYGNGNFGRTHI